ncbi:MAG: hypothetical protein Q9177_005201, partial [Variospora cf. flavescens]
MAISSRNNVQIIRHTTPHRTCRRPSTTATRGPSSSSSSSLTSTTTNTTTSPPHQLSIIATTWKMPAIHPRDTNNNNNTTTNIRSNTSSRTFHSTPPPIENSYPCSYSRNPKPPTRSLFKTPLTITVGPASQAFHVHREALIAASPFFAACLNPAYAFRESAANATVHLPAARAVDFEFLVQWIYTGALDHEELDAADHPAYFRLIRLWLLADALQVEGCKNGVVDAMARVADRSNSVPTPDDTRTVFGPEEGVREGAGLRALVVDLFAWKKTDQLVEGHED